jgi:N-acetyl-anhydromuramyl-L-alanine amidase AmpD
VDVPSENRNQRVSHLILHFTSENFAESLRLLTQGSANPVSAHYLVPDPTDPTYPRDRLMVHRLVPEAERAWHAGRSAWFGRTALNDSSIGIEIVNLSGCTLPGDSGQGFESDSPLRTPTQPQSQSRPERIGTLPDPVCTFLPYADQQIDLLIRLIRQVLADNPDIEPVDVIGHADIAPDRKVDPGPLFPWRRLHAAGIGAWYDDATMERYLDEFTLQLPELSLLQAALSAYGYDVEITGEADDRTRFAVRAFQMHFRPADYKGSFDAETAAILFALLEKYRAAGGIERNEDALAWPLGVPAEGDSSDPAT